MPERKWTRQEKTQWLKSWIEPAKSILILGHVRPDGDCVGSTLGLYNYIRDNWPEKKVRVCLGKFSHDFLLLRGADAISHKVEETAVYDLCIASDVSSLERLGDFRPMFERAVHRICVDHHATNPGFAEENIVEGEASAASEVLFTMMEEDKISKATAECLYLGIVHDTGVFKHSNTSRQTMEIAGVLIEKGVSTSTIIDQTFYHKTFLQNRILGKALLNATLELGGKLIYSAVSHAELTEYGVSALDLEGVIDQLRVTDGVECAMLVNETGTGECKVSMRANGDCDVSRIAMEFGGGGHIKAAGCTICGSLQEAKEKLIRTTERLWMES